MKLKRFENFKVNEDFISKSDNFWINRIKEKITNIEKIDGGGVTTNYKFKFEDDSEAIVNTSKNKVYTDDFKDSDAYDLVRFCDNTPHHTTSYYKIFSPLNEKLDDANYVSPVEQFDSDRKWFVVNVEEGEIVSAWDLLEDALKDGILDNLLIAQGILDEEQSWDFKDKIDDFLMEFGHFEDEEFDDENSSYIDDFLEEIGVPIFRIRHRSEL